MISKRQHLIKNRMFDYIDITLALCHALVTFRFLMYRVFIDRMDVLIVVYMDELLIFSRDEESNFQYEDIDL